MLEYKNLTSFHKMSSIKLKSDSLFWSLDLVGNKVLVCTVNRILVYDVRTQEILNWFDCNWCWEGWFYQNDGILLL